MSLRDVRDQQVPMRLLRNALTRKRIPNAMLFWGPGGVGKRMAAIEMAKAVNCLESTDDACDACLSCRKVASGNHPDIRVVSPLKKSRIIDVDTVEGLNEFASLRAYEGKWRVFVLLDADRMKGPAQNHFLKTLEEPAGNSLFILVSEYPRVLLPTIRSRCQMVRFGALRPETVAEVLRRERALGENAARAMAALAQGQMTRAFDLVDSERRAVVLDVAGRLADGDDPFEVAEEFSAYLDAQTAQIEAAVKNEFGVDNGNEFSREDRERLKEERMALVNAARRHDIMEHLYLFAAWYRDQLVYGATGDMAHVLNKDQDKRLECGGARDTAIIEKKILAIEKARLYLERFIKEDRVFRDLFFAFAE